MLAPGRSGSTLLQSVFLTGCDALTFFEPCRHAPSGDVRREECAKQVLRFLRCDLPARSDDWEPPTIRPWLQHPYRAANGSFSCTPPPFRSVHRLARVCSAARLVLVKEIRLVGQLATLAAMLPAPSTIVHLVRDPRPMLASQIKLQWWNLRKGGGRLVVRELERVARRTCKGMVADADAGAR